jgi:hypothetical protein
MENNKAVTAIEWLEEQLDIDLVDNGWYFEKAKQMEKQQIIDAYETSHISMMTSEQYYNETFK